MSIYRQEDSEGIIRNYVQEIESWDGFSEIVAFVLRFFESSMIKQVDGPDSRVCHILVEAHEITFVHDDMLGNCFFSEKESSQPVIEKISRQLSHRVTQCNP